MITSQKGTNMEMKSFFEIYKERSVTLTWIPLSIILFNLYVLGSGMGQNSFLLTLVTIALSVFFGLNLGVALYKWRFNNEMVKFSRTVAIMENLRRKDEEGK